MQAYNKVYTKQQRMQLVLEVDDVDVGYDPQNDQDFQFLLQLQKGPYGPVQEPDDEAKVSYGD